MLKVGCFFSYFLGMKFLTFSPGILRIEVHLAGEKIERFGDENAGTGGTSVRRPGQETISPCLCNSQIFRFNISKEILPDKLVLVASLGNLFSDNPSAPGRLDHVLLQLVDVLGVLLEGVADGCLEVVDGDKVGEEGEDVLDLDGRALLQELHCQLDVVLLLDHVFGNLNHVMLSQL